MKYAKSIFYRTQFYSISKRTELLITVANLETFDLVLLDCDAVWARN
jgi:hypothetical protein